MNRGMKKWAPYKSLNEQIDFINKMRYEKNKIERPLISNEEAENINNILTNYQNETVWVKYYDDGYLYEVSLPIFKIDIINKRIYFDKYSFLDFVNIIDMKVMD